MELIMYILPTLLLFVLNVENVSRHDPLKDAQIKVFTSDTVPYGEETAVMVTLAKYPTNRIVLELNTAKYLLLHQEVGNTTEPMPLPFSKTDNISEELSYYNIVSSKSVDYESGFYVVVNATFWQPMSDVLVLTGSMNCLPSVPAVTDSTEVYITKPSMCVPQLNVRRCLNPRQPLRVIIVRGIDLSVFFTKTCGTKNVPLNWTITDLMERELKSYVNLSTQFILKPYELQFPTVYELWRNRYVIIIKGEHNGMKFAVRCYVQSQEEKVEAVIRGGRYTKIKYSSILHMDGSRSRDFSKPSNIPQFQTYYWNCISSDMSNQVCRHNISSVSKFEIPGNSFHQGNKYEFELSVVSDYNPNIRSTTHQFVEIVNYECLDVSIICKENCAHNSYNRKSNIVLKAECYNCYNMLTSYLWFVDNVFTDATEILETQLDNNIVEIRLEVQTTDKRRGSEIQLFTQHELPSSGWCNINPTKGMEAKTRFLVCCQNFTTARPPLQYYYYAGRVLLKVCRGCNCALHLPLHLRFVKVLICDSEIACVIRYMKVNVTALANIKMSTPQKLWKFITTPPNDVVGKTARVYTSELMAYMQALASRIIGEPDKAMVLMRAYENVEITSLVALGKIANLTHTLAVQLVPIGSSDACVLIRSLSILNEIFQIAHDNKMTSDLVEEPYINVTVSCQTVYKEMADINIDLPLPPQAIYDKYKKAKKTGKLKQYFIDELLDDINSYSDEGIKRRTLIWLNSTWETERLYRFLRFARIQGIKEDEEYLNNVGVLLDNRCFEIEAGRTYKINTRDRMHTVYFSPELLQETKEPGNNTICLKIISNIRELNWWYPENRQPSNVLLTVHIYTGEDNFKEERKLEHSVIKHRTVIGKYKPAHKDNDTIGLQRHLRINKLSTKKRVETNYDDDDSVADTGKFVNCLEHGTLENIEDLRVYRTNLDELSNLAVRFQHTTHRLRALLIMDKLPKSVSRAMKKSGCVVPANSRNATMLMRNNCLKWHRVYLALQVDGTSAFDNSTVPGGPAQFSFVFQVRSCDSWMYSLGGDKQRWSHDFCLPELEFPRKDSIQCTCTVLGTYTSYVFHVPAITVPTDENLPVSINWWYMIMFFLVLFLLLLWIVALFVWYNKPHFKTVRCDMTGLEDKSDREVHDLLVYLKTGGRINALTTATVRIIFETQEQKELHFTLMQDPEHPELTRNSTYVLWLRTRDIRIPTRVAVSHDNSGRYPSWFLRKVELVDLQDKLTQVFLVHRWVRNKILVLSSELVFRVGDKKTVQRWRQRFTNELERQWINWGLWHPLTGMWRECAFNDKITRAQRASIFITKLIVVYCVCACYLGPTTPETVFADRKKFIECHDLVIMFMISFVVTNLVHYLLERCVSKNN